ncbi:hypothetical protein NM208_g15693 [Fusarium decemcellulare]|uniref:Uncharacterized protein n=1 Tax=Fusarium decemcellulare TaxID=57161 RepID=A0ACC1REW9_9HYPO|nr:hypothetical protein NM208_g15693 [Fusarium decemcellulare]
MLKPQQMQERDRPAPQKFTFGYQRATLLGAFFNGVFLLALSVSILVQAIERFTDISPVENPKLVLIVGGIGLGLNVVVLSFLHEHDHSDNHGHHEQQDQVAHDSDTGESPVNTLNDHDNHKHNATVTRHHGRDLGMLGVFIHVLGDAFNNIGVIIAAVVMWKAEGHGRYYIDPAVSVLIAIMILISAIPLTKNSGSILLQMAPDGVDLEDIKHDIESVTGVGSVHELHVWRLDQRKAIATAHVVVENETVQTFNAKAKLIMECLHAYGVHSITLQPEVCGMLIPRAAPASSTAIDTASSLIQMSVRNKMSREGCQMTCSSLCGEQRCCT